MTNWRDELRGPTSETMRVRALAVQAPYPACKVDPASVCGCDHHDDGERCGRHG